MLLYPAMTLFCIVVTANHYWIDGLGGIVVFFGGAAIGFFLHRWNQKRLDQTWQRRIVAATATAESGPAPSPAELAEASPETERETVSRTDPE